MDKRHQCGQSEDEKKYAFVSDYVRLVALYQYGGIYLDTDVMLKKSFDPFLSFQAFTGFENENKLTSAIIGAEKGFSVIGEYLNYYKNRCFVSEDGTINNEANVVMMTDICIKHGLVLNDSRQEVEGMQIFPRAYFCPLDFYHNDWSTEETVCVHFFDASWLDGSTKKMIMKERTKMYKLYTIVRRKIAGLLCK